MSGGPTDRLTEKQREVLRLYYQNFEIKEIARLLGVNDHAVTERLRNARRMLGAARSMDAARLLAAAEGYSRTVDTPSGLATAIVHPQTDDHKRPDGPVAVVANRYELSVLQRLGIVMLAAIGFVVLSGSMAMGIYALSYVFKTQNVSVAEKPYTR